MNIRFPNSQALVDLNALDHNLAFLKQLAGDGKKVMAVIKADAYSHGAVRIARHLEGRTDWLAVANTDEAIELREAGIKAPLLVFGIPAESSAAACREYNLTATVSDAAHFDILPGGTHYHINFDTGMGRQGFRPEQRAEVRNLVLKHPGLTCTGIYSHYATTDDPGSEFAKEQLQRFEQICVDFPEIPLKHMSNSGAIVYYNEFPHFDMTRTGLGLFGYTPGHLQPPELKPVLRWQTHLAAVKKIYKGDTVSYGATWKAAGKTTIGTLPVGYADGLPRSLGNKLKVLIRGRYFPVVGNVTMDYTMVDLGEEAMPAGTDVTLLGGDAWPAGRWAETAGTNIHEILTNLTGRVQKVYLTH